MNNDLNAYYARRAATYEAIYAKPERQTDLQAIENTLREIFQGKNVLEIACGTGYWTEKIAVSANSVLATDINEPVLEIARSKSYPPEKVRFEQSDLYDLSPGPTTDALFGGFIWSHIPLEELGRFTDKVNSLAGVGGTVVFLDNRFVAGSSTPLAEIDSNGNTYQQRPLPDGSSHLILKNFPEIGAIEQDLTGKSQNFRGFLLPFYWLCAYEVPEK